MSASSTTELHKTLLCHLGRHRNLWVQDDNPENRRSAHLECTRCGHLTEIREYERSSSTWMVRGGPFIAG